MTGISGYIGSVMAPILHAAGHEVVGFDTNYFLDCILGGEPPSFDTIRKDIRDVRKEDVQGFDAVIHLAALSNDPMGELNPDITYDINHLASVRLAKAAKSSGVRRFLYSSSCSMYGAAGEDFVGEEAPLRPITPYAVSKVRTEEDLRGLADETFSPVYLRNATVYGASSRIRADLVLNNLVCWAHTTGTIRILSDGTPWRPIVHVEDLTAAFLAALEAPLETIHNQAFNVGIGSENYQVRDLAEIVQGIVPGCRVEYAEGGGPDSRSYRVDFSKIRNILPGFQPRWNARLGAEQLYRAVRDARLTLEDFQGRKYIRLTQLKYLISQGEIDKFFRWRNR